MKKKGGSKVSEEAGVYVICPYYKWDKDCTIRCEGHCEIPGAVEGRAIAFPNGTARYRYRVNVCSSFDYADKCPYAEFLNDLYMT